VADVDLDDLKVVDNPGESRFEVRVGDEAAFVEYRSTSSAIAYIHTEVPESLRERGIAARLAKHALDFARAEGLPVVPLCPYVAEYIRQHPEYEDVVAPRRLWRDFLRGR
jgi:predicted GNAT family acetyltransferase